MDGTNDERLPGETDEEEDDEIMDYMAVDPEDEDPQDNSNDADKPQVDPDQGERRPADASQQPDHDMPDRSDAGPTLYNLSIFFLRV